MEDGQEKALQAYTYNRSMYCLKELRKFRRLRKLADQQRKKSIQKSKTRWFYYWINSTIQKRQKELCIRHKIFRNPAFRKWKLVISNQILLENTMREWNTIVRQEIKVKTWTLQLKLKSLQTYNKFQNWKRILSIRRNRRKILYKIIEKRHFRLLASSYNHWTEVDRDKKNDAIAYTFYGEVRQRKAIYNLYRNMNIKLFMKERNKLGIKLHERRCLSISFGLWKADAL